MNDKMQQKHRWKTKENYQNNDGSKNDYKYLLQGDLHNSLRTNPKTTERIRIYPGKAINQPHSACCSQCWGSMTFWC
jgi:hypothetical protein